MQKDRESDILIARYLEGEISTEQLDILRAKMDANPDLVCEIFNQAEQECDLRILSEQGIKAWRGKSQRNGEIVPFMGWRSAVAGIAAAIAICFVSYYMWGSGEIVAEVVEATADSCLMLDSVASTADVPVRHQGYVGRVISWGGQLFGVGAREQSLQVGDMVREGDKIHTGPNGMAVLVYLDGTRVVLGADCDLSFESTLSRLEKGSISAEVAKQKRGSPFLFETPQALVTVLGTRFSLAIEGERFRNTGTSGSSLITDVGVLKSRIPSTRLSVDEGLVAFARLSDGRSIKVAAGQYAVAGDGLKLVAFSQGTGSDSVYVRGPIVFEDNFDKGLGSWEQLSGEDATRLVPVFGSKQGTIVLGHTDKVRSRFVSLGKPMLSWVALRTGKQLDDVACLRMNASVTYDAFEVQAFVLRKGDYDAATPFLSARVVKVDKGHYFVNLPTYMQIRWECSPAGLTKDGESLLRVRAFVTNLRAPGLKTKELWLQTSYVVCEDRRIAFVTEGLLEVRRMEIRRLESRL